MMRNPIKAKEAVEALDSVTGDPMALELLEDAVRRIRDLYRYGDKEEVDRLLSAWLTD